jgi:DNA (cytosine-5)-methyltransferase 1
MADAASIRRRPLRVLDLYAGAGGLSEGFRRAGYEVAMAIEKDPDAAETLRANHDQTTVVEENVCELDADALLDLADGPVEVLVAGPPCQGFSIQGERRRDHESVELLFQVARVAAAVRPLALVVENVQGLVSFANGYVFDRFMRELNRLSGRGESYNPVVETLDAADFGVPQRRRRIFITGVLGEVFTFPPPSSEPVSLLDAIGDLPEWTTVPGECAQLPRVSPLTRYQRARRRGTRVLHNHSAKQLEAVRSKRLAVLNEGDDRRALPDHLQAGGREGKYRRLRGRLPAPTIMAHMAKDTSDFIHPRYDRMLTVREAARLQSFDDSYRFNGSQYQQFRQVGNAVPPLLAEAIAVALEMPVRQAFVASQISTRRRSATT